MLGTDVVVVTYNSERHLRRCVEPLARSADTTVIVVDSASTDRTLETIIDLDITAVGLGENRGFAHACNVGWRLGQAPFVLFLNPDARIEVESLRIMVDAAEAAPELAALCPRIVDAGGALDFSLRRFPRLRSTYAQALFLHRIFPRGAWSDELVRNPGAYTRPWSPEWASGACLLVRRSVLAQLNGFDEGFFLYCEDLDLCRRIRDAGYQLTFEPRALARHEGGASAPRAALLPILTASRIRYAQKHQSRVIALLERLGILVGALTHAAAARGSAATRGHLRAAVRALRR